MLVRVKGEVVIGTGTTSLGLSAVDGENLHRLGLVTEIHRGESVTIAGVGTFTLKEAHSGTVWFTPNLGGAAFCLDPDPTFTMNNFAQQGHWRQQPPQRSIRNPPTNGKDEGWGPTGIPTPGPFTPQMA